MAKALLFDLDNTLYPASSGIEREIISRMIGFVADLLRVSAEEAAAARKLGLGRHPTTYAWLCAEHGPIDYEAYSAAVHPVGEEASLSPDPELARLLRADPRPKYIFTNAVAEHAERFALKLGIRDCFLKIYDIRFVALRGKPAPEAFSHVLSDAGLRAEDVCFFDDMGEAVREFIKLGGEAYLIDEGLRHRDLGLPSLRRVDDYWP
jgi:putative hydrolase of the HAD superfamily